MFRSFNKMKRSHQLVFTIVVAFAVISFWRGVWDLMDEFLFPQNMPLSATISMIIGLVILYLTDYATKELI